MKESVVIKGTKSGIILVLDDKLPYEQLKEAVADKFHRVIFFISAMLYIIHHLNYFEPNTFLVPSVTPFTVGAL